MIAKSTSHAGHSININIKGVHDGPRKTPSGVEGSSGRGPEQLPAFKGARAGAKRAGDCHFDGYPDCSSEGNGHPGAHQP